MGENMNDKKTTEAPLAATMMDGAEFQGATALDIFEAMRARAHDKGDTLRTYMLDTAKRSSVLLGRFRLDRLVDDDTAALAVSLLRELERTGLAGVKGEL